GSIALCTDFAILGLSITIPAWASVWGPLSDAMALVSGVCYFLGFAPPSILRRAWQEPELRAFLGRAATLPRLPTTEAIVEQMARGAASSLGAPNATIGLWDESEGVLHLHSEDGLLDLKPDRALPSGRAFLDQVPVV